MEKCSQLPDEKLNVLAKQYTELIDQLPGVMNSNVVFSGQEISEIHILAAGSRPAKCITRDVQSALAARFGRNIDYRLISIAQIPGKSFPGGRARLIFNEISLVKGKERTSAAVTLSDGSETFTGTASALSERGEINRMICQATLEAVEKYMDNDLELSVSDVRLFELGGENAAAVHIVAKKEDRLEHLIGSAFLDDDAGMAVVKATLDALNRRIAVG